MSGAGIGPPSSAPGVQAGEVSRRSRSFALLLVTAACVANPYVERRVLVGDPAWKLRMPGSEELAHFSDERRMTLDGPVDAYDGFAFGTQASDLEVFAFYDGELRRMGWRQERLIYAATTELRVWAWCKPPMLFRVGIEDQERAFRPEFYRGRSYVTVFDARLQGWDPDAPCPKP